jgi:hypothetical protein
MVERDSGCGASLSLWELCEGNLKERLPCWCPKRIGRKVVLGIGCLSLKRLTADGLKVGLCWGSWVMKGRL